MAEFTPKVRVGDTILYFRSESDWKKYRGPDEKLAREVIPAPGIVNTVGDESINLTCFPARSSNIAIPKTGVKHVGAKNKTQRDLEIGGFWDYSDEWYEKVRLCGLVDAMQGTVDTLLAAIGRHEAQLHELRQQLGDFAQKAYEGARKPTKKADAPA